MIARAHDLRRIHSPQCTGSPCRHIPTYNDARQKKVITVLPTRPGQKKVITVRPGSHLTAREQHLSILPRSGGAPGGARGGQASAPRPRPRRGQRRAHPTRCRRRRSPALHNEKQSRCANRRETVHGEVQRLSAICGFDAFPAPCNKTKLTVRQINGSMAQT